MNNYKLIIILIDYFFISFIFVPIAIGILSKKQLSKPESYLLYFLISIISIEIISEIFRYNNTRNHFLYYFQTLLILIFTYLFFRENSQNNKVKKALFYCFWSIALLLPVEAIFISGFNQLNSVTKTLLLIFISFFSVFFLRKELANYNKEIKKQLFFFNIGLAVFGLISIIPSIFDKLFIESAVNLFYFFETLSLIGNAVAYVFFAIGFRSRKMKLSPS